MLKHLFKLRVKKIFNLTMTTTITRGAVVLLLVISVGACRQSVVGTNEKAAQIKDTNMSVSKANPEPVLLPLLDSAFGPMLGTNIKRISPVPGKYLARLQFHQSKFHTREIFSSQTIAGHTEFDIRSDGSAIACFAGKHLSHSSMSKYAPGSAGGSTVDTNDMWILGAWGKWTPKGDTISVSFDIVRRESCDLSVNNETGVSHAPLKMECVTIQSNERLPEDALICRGLSIPGLPGDIAIAPGNTPRAGPFALQRDPSKRNSGPLQEDRWFIGGKEPGLLMVSNDEREHAMPVVMFTTTEVKFLETDYRESDRERKKRINRETHQLEQNHPVGELRPKPRKF